VQDKLGAHTNCAAFDVQAVCAGFTYALAIADAFIRTGTYKKVLVLGAETFSRILDFQDRTTSVLFGDGAGAVVLEASNEPGILATALHADGSQRDILCVPGRAKQGGVEGTAYLTMDGPAVFKLAVKVLEQVAHEALEKANLKSEQIDWLVPHQANIRIIQSTAKKLKLSMDKVILTVAEHGNTSAASIPLALDAGVRSGQLQAGHLVMLEGVGGGFAWGSILLRY
jgi:3-oxoacyl-[acyl-carrier-protein] synthase-3